MGNLLRSVIIHARSIAGNNMRILNSASKIVFILIALTACMGFILGKLPTDSFMILATGAFAFYFSAKGDQTPYGGK